MSHFEVPKSYLCDILLNVKNEVRNANTLLTYIDQDYDINSVDKEIMKKQLETTFIPTFKTKLSKVCNNVSKFRVFNEKWLNYIFIINCTGKRGRPKSDSFEECSRSTKFRKINDITDLYSPKEIDQAFFKNLRDSGKSQ